VVHSQEEDLLEGECFLAKVARRVEGDG
jgi:hypothetical protein